MRLPKSLLEKIDNVKNDPACSHLLNRTDIIRMFIAQGLDNLSKKHTTAYDDSNSMMKKINIFLHLVSIQPAQHYQGMNREVEIVYLLEVARKENYGWFFNLSPKTACDVLNFPQTEKMDFLFDQVDNRICDKFKAFNDIIEMLEITDFLFKHKFRSSDTNSIIKKLSEVNEIPLKFTGCCDDHEVLEMISIIMRSHSRRCINLFDSGPSVESYYRFKKRFEEVSREYYMPPNLNDLEDEVATNFLLQLVNSH